MTNLNRLFSGVVFAAVVSAQDGIGMAGPGSSYFYDSPTRAVRELRGPAGAALVGRAAVEEIQFADVAPNGRTAVVLKQGRHYWIADLNRPDDAVTLSLSPVELSAWSADSNSFASYRGEPGLVERVRSGRMIEPVLLGPGLLSLALNRDGSELAGGGEAGVVRHSDALGVRATQGLRARSIAFASGRDAILAVDAGSREVVEISSTGSRVLMSTAQIGGDPLELLELDGGQVCVLTAQEFVVARLDGPVVRRGKFDTAFGRPRQIGAGSFLSKRAAAGDPLYLLDFAREEGLFFVPVTEK